MEKIGIIGLGYVGLPLAVEFGNVTEVVGFDISRARVEELKRGIDRTKEVGKDELLGTRKLKFSCEKEDLKECNYFIITVPTPVDEFKKPDLRPLESASHTVGEVLKKRDIVI